MRTVFNVICLFVFFLAKWWGPKDKKPLIAIHGLKDNSGTFDPLIKLLPKDLSILCIDLIGHGRSSHMPQVKILLFYNKFNNNLHLIFNTVKHRERFCSIFNIYFTINIILIIISYLKIFKYLSIENVVGFSKLFIVGWFNNIKKNSETIQLEMYIYYGPFFGC